MLVGPTLQDILDAMEKRAGGTIGHIHSIDGIVWGLYIDHRKTAPTHVRQHFTRTYRARNGEHVTIGFDADSGTIY